MDKILVALDGSEHSNKALTLAIDLAKGSGARLVLLHVISDQPLSQGECQFATQERLPTAAEVGIPGLSLRNRLGGSVERWRADVEFAVAARHSIGERILREGTGRAKAAGIASVECRIECGDPAKKILEASRSELPHLLIVGNRGLGNLQGMLLGSVSREVAQHADCTCVTVK